MTDEGLDDENAACNPGNEAKSRAQMTLLEFGRKKTRHRATADLNQETLAKWSSNLLPLRPGECKTPALLCFMPKDEHKNKGVCVRSSLDVSDRRMVTKLIQEVLVIEKATRQIAFQLRMDLKLHLGATTRMAQKVREESPLGSKVHQCSRNTGHGKHRCRAPMPTGKSLCRPEILLFATPTPLALSRTNLLCRAL
jgi:hypothetical protein